VKKVLAATPDAHPMKHENGRPGYSPKSELQNIECRMPNRKSMGTLRNSTFCCSIFCGSFLFLG